MLILMLAQALIQMFDLFGRNPLVTLLAVFPLFAILFGAVFRLLVGSLWAALAASAVAFASVALVLFSPLMLVYTPVYVLLSLAGYVLTYWLASKKLTRAEPVGGAYRFAKRS